MIDLPSIEASCKVRLWVFKWSNALPSSIWFLASVSRWGTRTIPKEPLQVSNGSPPAMIKRRLKACMRLGMPAARRPQASTSPLLPKTCLYNTALNTQSAQQIIAHDCFSALESGDGQKGKTKDKLWSVCRTPPHWTVPYFRKKEAYQSIYI